MENVGCFPKGCSFQCRNFRIKPDCLNVRSARTNPLGRLQYTLFDFDPVFILSVPTGSPSPGGDVVVYVKDINQPSLPTPFYNVLVSISVFMALSTVFDSINSPDNSPLSNSVLLILLCLTGPFNYISLYESLLQP